MQPSSPVTSQMLPGCHDVKVEDGANHSLLFTVEDKPGALDACLHVFKDAAISLRHIESRPSKTFSWDYDMLVEFRGSVAAVPELVRGLKAKGAKSVQHIGADPVGKANGTPMRLVTS